MRTIGIISKPEITKHKQFLQELTTFLKPHAKNILFDEFSAPIVKKSSTDLEKMLATADLVIILGGDGTVLKTARSVASSKKVLLLSVNMGKLGFLTAVNPDQVYTALEAIFKNKTFVDDRFLLRVTLYRNNKKIFTSLAANEAVISQGCVARLMHLHLEANHRKVVEFKADGLIVATPTGSTGHALSAGGPILHPSLPGFLIVPICPSSLANRPIVIPNNRQLTITIGPNKHFQPITDAGLTLDGQVFFPVQSGDVIKIRKSRRKYHLVRMKQSGYYEMLRGKLGWGE